MKKRLFVGNLASDIQEEELRKRFGKFGHVENVELHTKKDESDVPLRTFAYLDIGLSQEKLINCIKTYNNTVWKGNNIIVQVAKESYIQRIRREAERINQGEISMSDKNEVNHNARIGDSNITPIKTEKMEKYSQENDERLDVTIVKKSRITYPAEKKVDPLPDEFSQEKSFLFDDLPANGSQGFEERPYFSGEATAALDHRQSFETVVNGESVPRGQEWPGKDFEECNIKAERGPKGGSFIEVKRRRRELDNERRLQALEDKATQSKMQHKALKSAFASLDSGVSYSNKKIVFRDSDDDEEGDAYKEVVQQASKGRTLFNEGDNEDGQYLSAQVENDFRVRPQFQGKKGKKVWELQSKIGTDERFRLNEQFVESEDDHDDDGYLEEDTHGENVDERMKYLRVLQDIVGRKLTEDGKPLQKASAFKDTRKLRFDPAKEDSSKFEVKKEATTKKKEKKEIPPHEQLPEVSKEQFYEVSSSLKEALSRKQIEEGSFSFSQMFHPGDDDSGGEYPFPESDSDEGASQKGGRGQPGAANSSRQKGKSFEENPFKYDSSDGEEPQNVAETAGVEDESVNQDGRFLVKVDPSRFFFVPGDRRLLEGVQFFRKHEDNDTIAQKWEAVREEIFTELMSRRKLAKKAAEKKYGKKKAWKATQQK